MSKPVIDPNVVKLTNVRLSYPNLFVAKASSEGGDPKFSASFLLNKKDHAALIAQVEKTIERVALDFFKKKVKLNKTCLRDGNEKEDKEGYGDEVMFITSSNTTRPAVVDQNKAPLTAEDAKPYGGCYVNAVIRLFAYDHKVGGKGVSASLQAVQFAKNGESFGAGRVNVDEVFDVVPVDDVDNF